jgi:hypothetical protein
VAAGGASTTGAATTGSGGATTTGAAGSGGGAPDPVSCAVSLADRPKSRSPRT